MAIRMVVKALVVWIAILVPAVLNGLLRESALVPRLSARHESGHASVGLHL